MSSTPLSSASTSCVALSVSTSYPEPRRSRTLRRGECAHVARLLGARLREDDIDRRGARGGLWGRGHPRMRSVLAERSRVRSAGGRPRRRLRGRDHARRLVRPAWLDLRLGRPRRAGLDSLGGVPRAPTRLAGHPRDARGGDAHLGASRRGRRSAPAVLSPARPADPGSPRVALDPGHSRGPR